MIAMLSCCTVNLKVFTVSEAYMNGDVQVNSLKDVMNVRLGILFISAAMIDDPV